MRSNRVPSKQENVSQLKAKIERLEVIIIRLKEKHYQELIRYLKKAKKSSDNILKRAIEQKILVSNNMGDFIKQTIQNSTIHGSVAAKMEHCTNIIGQQLAGPKKVLLEQLQSEATALLHALPEDERAKASTKLQMLVDQASAEEPEREWYSLSAKGLIKASAFVKDFTGNIAGTIGQLGKLLWPDFKLPTGDEDS